MRGALVTGVQTCALPISRPTATRTFNRWSLRRIPQRLASGLPAFRQAVAIRLSAVAWCGSWSPIIHADRKSVVQGKSVSVSVDLGGRRILNKENSLLNRLEPQFSHSVTND